MMSISKIGPGKNADLMIDEQDVAVSLSPVRRAYDLENGYVTLTGTGADLLHDDQMRQAYMEL